MKKIFLIIFICLVCLFVSGTYVPVQDATKINGGPLNVITINTTNLNAVNFNLSTLTITNGALFPQPTTLQWSNTLSKITLLGSASKTNWVAATSTNGVFYLVATNFGTVNSFIWIPITNIVISANPP